MTDGGTGKQAAVERKVPWRPVFGLGLFLGGLRRLLLGLFPGDLGLGTLFRPEEELQAVHVVEGVDPGFFLRGFLLGFLLLGQQAQGEQVKVVQGGQAAGAFGVWGMGNTSWLWFVPLLYHNGAPVA